MARLTPPKSPIVYENKHHSGCMWGLYSLFESGQSKSNQKLISDKNRALKRDFLNGDGNASKPSSSVLGFDEKSQVNNNDTKNEKKRKKEEVTKSTHSGSEFSELPNRNVKPSKPSQLNGDSAKHKKLPHPSIVGTSTDKMEAAFGKNKSKKNKKRGCGCKNMDFVKYDELLKVNDVAEAIVNQKLIEGKYLSRDGVNTRSKQLLDALEILNSNKDLFTKLLQDPNSLLVKHIQDLRDSQIQKESEGDASNEKEKIDPQASSEIVVLKTAGGQSSKSIHFSFEDLKKKFKHAVMGVKRKDSSLTTTVSIEGSRRGEREIVRNKAIEDYSFDANRRDKIEKLRDFKARIGQEMASNDAYRKNLKSGCLGDSHMRFSPYGYSQVAYNDWKLAKEQQSSSYSRSQASCTKMFEADSSFRGEANQMDILSKIEDNEKIDSAKLISSKINVTDANVRKEPCMTLSSETANTSEETEDSESSRLDSSLEDQSSTCSSNVFPSTPSSIHRVDGPDCSRDIGELSPISVLEQFFSDVACPPSKPCQPETISEYVKAVLLQASISNQDQPSVHLKEFNKLLGPSFVEAVNSNDIRFSGDRKLIFDCVSEVLIDIHDTHFRHTPWLSSASLDPKTHQPLEVIEKFVTREAMKCFEFLSELESSSQRPMDWLIGNDLSCSSSWLDTRTDTYDIVDQIAEDGLEELILESIVDLYI